MKKGWLIVISLVIVIASVGLACPVPRGGEPNQADTQGHQISQREHQIRQVLNKFAKAYESRNIELLKETLWEESTFFRQIVKNAELDFARYSQIDVEFTQIRIGFCSRGKNGHANTWKKLRGKERETNIERYREFEKWFSFREAEGEWVIACLYFPASMIPPKEYRLEELRGLEELLREHPPIPEEDFPPEPPPKPRIPEEP